MILLQSTDIHLVDQDTCRRQNISSYTLMERAAKSATQEMMRLYPDRQRPCYIFAGSGNNGGDALVVYRLLYEAGYNVKCYHFNLTGRLSDDCAIALSRAPRGRLISVDVRFVMPEPDAQSWIVDGLFGTGLNRPLDGFYAYVVKCINDSGAEIVSLDVPSGLMSESHAMVGVAAVRATHTLTFTTPKLNFLFPENQCFVGEWKVLDIGVESESMERLSSSPYRVLTRAEVQSMLHLRNRFDHKGVNGHAALVAGSRGMMGAALLAARACMRSGVGLLSLYTPRCGYQIIQSGIPEAMCLPTDSEDHLAMPFPSLEAHSAIAIGPGIGRHSDTATVLETLLKKEHSPMVLDADALNLLSMHPQLLTQMGQRQILTPHPKEADRLLKAALEVGLLKNRISQSYFSMSGDAQMASHRLLYIRALAQELRCVIVLKGTYTAICMPDGTAWFNVEHGNPGMAVGGSGDTLTGIILSFLAQRYSPQQAALLGVYIHALAADQALLSGQSYESLLPSDVIVHLGKAFSVVREK